MRWLAWAWGIGGIFLLLAQALTALVPLACAAIEMPWSAGQWAFAVSWVLFMGYAEGYRGFQTRFSPRVVRRAIHLFENPRPLHLLFAPLFCMGLIHASRKRIIANWALVGGIAGLVLAVGMLAQPWRGLVDLGVVLGLGWGMVAIVGFVVRTARGRPPDIDPDLP